MKFLTKKDGEVLQLPARDGLPETVHVFDAGSVDAVNAALAAGRPLLVRGEPGTGKSQLARAVAEALGRAFHTTTIDARTEPRDLLWTFDVVARLAEAQVAGVMKVRDEDEIRKVLRPERFLEPGPLWWALDREGASRQAEQAKVDVPKAPESWKLTDGVVLLIDEIDKADASVPNGLLEALGSGRFTCPGDQVVARVAEHEGQDVPWPLIVITTNEERTLPDAFLRRCLVLHLRWPDDREELIDRLVARGRSHFPGCDDEVLRRAAGQLADDRATVASNRQSPPGGAEYLDLLRAVTALAEDSEIQKTLEADDATGRRLELLQRVGRYTLIKHPRPPR